MTGIRSDAKLERLIGSLRQLGSTYGARRVTASLAEEAVTQIKLGFRKSQDPDGLPWARLKSRSGQPLRKSGRLQNSFTYAISGNSEFTIGTNVQYAATHQYGATIRPVKAKALAFKVQNPRMNWKTGKMGVRTTLTFATKVVIPARPMVPERTLGLLWEHAFREAASEAVRDIMKGTALL